MRIDDNAVPGEIATLKELVTLSDTTGKNRFRARKVMETHIRSRED
jgi:hypothetical protein